MHLQVLVDALGLNTGERTQTKQSARCIMAKLHSLGMRRARFWMGHATRLTRAAQDQCHRYMHTLRGTDKMGLLMQSRNRLVDEEAAVYRHVIISEVVAWYAKDETRMRDFENMDIISIVPTLPAGCSVN